MATLDETIDLDLDGDMQPHAPAVAGILAVMRRLRRRWTTRRGTFPWWKDFGTDLRQYLLSKAPAWRIAKDAELEAEKDDQVSSIALRVDILDGGRRIRMTGIVVSSAVKNFRFTMDITQASGSLVTLQEAA